MLANRMCTKSGKFPNVWGEERGVIGMEEGRGGRRNFDLSPGALKNVLACLKLEAHA